MFRQNMFTVMVLLSICEFSIALRILAVFPFPIMSHTYLGNGVVKHLLEAGHEVTYITPISWTYKHPKLNLLHTDVKKDAIFNEQSFNIDTHLKQQVNLNDEYFYITNILNSANASLQDDKVQELLHDPDEHFDVIVAQWLFHEIYSGFSAVFKCPYIWLNPFEPNAMSLSLIDEHTNPAYVPQLISSNVPPFNFLQRSEELFEQIMTMMRKKFYFMKIENEIYESAFAPALKARGEILPSFEVMRLNASLMFGCSHVSLGTPMRLPQNFKDIGGFHIDGKMQPLSKDLQKIMDEAKHGVIYFSMGSNLKSKYLPPAIKNGLLKVFGQLKQLVIWKFEEDFPDRPKNVHIMSWAPQQSILAHPNCVLFITHGGLLSATEAVHFGVPTVGIPVFVDQFNNVDRAVKKGYAKRVDLGYDLPQHLKIAVEEILSDPSYAAKMKMLSSTFHDRLAPPGKELVFWVEHVAKTQGAPLLKSPALGVPFYQKLYLDLLLVIILAAVILYTVFKSFFCAVSVKIVRQNVKKIL